MKPSLAADYWSSYYKQHGVAGLARLALQRVLSLRVARKLKRCGKLTLQPGTEVSGARWISVGGLTAGKRLRLEALGFFGGREYEPSVVFGRGVSLGTDVHIACIQSIEIGDDVLIGSYVTIIDHDHGCYRAAGSQGSEPTVSPAMRPLSSAPICLDDRVHLGDHVVILKGVHIGAGAVVGAGSVVTRNVPEGAVVAGNPARVVRLYSREENAWIPYENKNAVEQ